MFLEKIFNIKNKTIIVAGSNSGIGLEIATSLIKLKAKLIRIDKTFTTKLSSDDYLCDISNEKSVSSCIKIIGKKYKKVDGLVNCAGITLFSKKPYNETILFSKTMAVNLIGAFNLCSNYCTKLNSKKSSVVNITSLGANLAFPLNPSYQASKAGLKQLTKSFARDFSKNEIRFNNICPGYIKTKMTKLSYDNPIQKKIRDNRMMLNRWGSPKDIVGCVIYLLTDASSYVTGAEINIDGGWLAKGL
jgi:NAD(P)-dependent dehydrogenase (short-subunit alcohol dehydrogenase family)